MLWGASKCQVIHSIHPASFISQPDTSPHPPPPSSSLRDNQKGKGKKKNSRISLELLTNNPKRLTRPQTPFRQPFQFPHVFIPSIPHGHILHLEPFIPPLGQRQRIKLIALRREVQFWWIPGELVGQEIRVVVVRARVLVEHHGVFAPGAFGEGDVCAAEVEAGDVDVDHGVFWGGGLWLLDKFFLICFGCQCLRLLLFFFTVKRRKGRLELKENKIWKNDMKDAFLYKNVLGKPVVACGHM